MYRIECDLKPTEDASKLLKSLKLLFPETNFKVSKDVIVGESDLAFFRELSAKQESSLVIEELETNGSVCIDKLAMSAGIVSLDDDFPLGRVRIVRE